jgi:2,4-dienoyl-CoA reductase-like NADH-dependent reductase (Old Yellow Enzyme family)
MTPTLDQSITLPCGVTLKNRLLKSAMSETLGTWDNHVTEALPRLYAVWAQGGTGTLITGNVMIDRRALGEHNNVVLEDDRDMDLLRAWAAAGTTGQTQLWMQLNHPGRQVLPGVNRESVAPSAVPFSRKLSLYLRKPRALLESEIEELVVRFGKSAALAKQAGFTGVQIHGAHGYLVSQFLSPHDNRREDAWGGTPQKRMRFVTEVYRSIRQAVGASFPVSIKLNSADFQKGGFSEEESLDVVTALSELGIDLIEISGGNFETPAMATGGPQKESTRRREAYFLEFAARVRTRTRAPLSVTGGFRTRAGIEAALADGALDVVGLARPLALDPAFSNQLMEDANASSLVKPLRTWIPPIDRAGLMEVAWYARQIHRMGRGEQPRPDENLTLAALAILASQALTTVTIRSRRRQKA